MSDEDQTNWSTLTAEHPAVVCAICRRSLSCRDHMFCFAMREPLEGVGDEWDDE